MPRLNHGLITIEARRKGVRRVRLPSGFLTFVPSYVHSISSKLAAGSLVDVARIEAVKDVERVTNQVARNIPDLMDALSVYHSGSNATETMSSNLPSEITNSVRKTENDYKEPAASYDTSTYDKPDKIDGSLDKTPTTNSVKSSWKNDLNKKKSASDSKIATPSSPTLSGSGCFIAGTLVDSVYGDLQIENVKPGDLVDIEFGWAEVSQVISSMRDDLVMVRTSGTSLVCSPNHRFATLDGWKEASRLRPGEILREGQRVIGVGDYAGRHRVYNLDVNHPSHVYLVSGHLVHNYKSVY